jgi:hypothetical protein
MFGSRRALVGLAAVGLSVLSVAAAGAVSASNSATASAGSASQAGRPLHTALLDPHSFSLASAPDKAIAFRRMDSTGAKFVRLFIDWATVAPAGANKPTGFDARDHRDPLYKWDTLDADLRLVTSNGLTPIVYVVGAPKWAWGEDSILQTPVKPSPSMLADFATALAKRYPRVRYWQVWNEANLWQFLYPQHQDGKNFSPGWYRSMVNAMAKAVHDVRRSNVVIAGALAPYGGGEGRIRPLEFMREMLCMSKGAKPRPTCDEKTEFDIWAHHAYSYGGPTSHALHADDVAIGDVGEMRSLLMAAERAGHVVSRGQPDFWVTEYSYESRPPDPKGVPLPLHTRWVAESLYRLWQDGVSLVTWFYLRDGPTDQPFQSGLYFRNENGIAGDKPKPALRAFRFPFVAFRAKGGAATFWGRTPREIRTSVVVEQQAGSKWRRVASPAVDRFGIFSGRAKAGGGALRARLANGKDVSAPFSLKVPKDKRYCLFGIIC